MPHIVGIEITKHAVYAAIMRTAFRKQELERYVRIPLTEAPDAPGRTPEVHDAIQGLLGGLGHPPESVIVPMYGDLISLKQLHLPEAAQKRIAEVLPFELETQLPFEPDDAIIDYQQSGVRNGEIHLTVAAAPKHTVERAIEDCHLIGLDPRELAAGSSAFDGLAHLMPELASEEALCIIDLGDQRTDICLLEGGKLRVARTLSLGLDALPAQADNLWRGLQRTIATFRANGGAPVSRALLGGTCAREQGALEWIGGRLELEVEVVQLPAAAAGQSEPGHMRALALAGHGLYPGRHLNMRSGEFASNRGGEGLLQHTNLAAGCLVAVLVCMMFALKAEQSMLVDEQEALKAELATMSKDIFDVRVTDPEKVEKLIKNQRSGDPLPGFDAFDALAAISDSVPQDIVHEVRRLRVDVADDKHEGRFELQGSLESIEQRDAIVAKLEAHECFRDIEKGRTTPARDKKNINYQIEANVQCPGEASSKKKGRKR